MLREDTIRVLPFDLEDLQALQRQSIAIFPISPDTVEAVDVEPWWLTAIEQDARTLQRLMWWLAAPTLTDFFAFCHRRACFVAFDTTLKQPMGLLTLEDRGDATAQLTVAYRQAFRGPPAAMATRILLEWCFPRKWVTIGAITPYRAAVAHAVHAGAKYITTDWNPHVGRRIHLLAYGLWDDSWIDKVLYG